ncbi:hypothetical protein [Janthinobacterium sp.]|uniref:hypothetical protein n=1 Tax=Janthinobacterium sp. TaxID=1871054 RepID=UPI0039773578
MAVKRRHRRLADGLQAEGRDEAVAQARQPAFRVAAAARGQQLLHAAPVGGRQHELEGVGVVVARQAGEHLGVGGNRAFSGLLFHLASE